ncbi:hypothetical protein [Bacillus paranthracis]|uniref:hypothetical protein n=1 Tax=Bacillus paranthracis TaxID=2026186 RepID=UPI0021F945BA|nr:hypothetical protein [Bacillus paranthracis]UXR28875.1 hypothetical protein [Bacillus phage Nachito]
MKLVVYGDNKEIFSLHEGLQGVIVEDKYVEWEDGMIPEVGANFIVVEDSVEIPTGFLTDEVIAKDVKQYCLSIKRQLAIAKQQLKETEEENKELKATNSTLTGRLVKVENTSIQLMNMIIGMQMNGKLPM